MNRLSKFIFLITIYDVPVSKILIFAQMYIFCSHSKYDEFAVAINVLLEVLY